MRRSESTSYSGRVTRKCAPAMTSALTRSVSAPASGAPGLTRVPMQNEVLVVSGRPSRSRPAFSPASSATRPSESTSQIPSTAG